MKIIDYFATVKGQGVLATADSEGKVDVAVFARPHFMNDSTIAFIMGDHLTHHNLQSNPYAAYLFFEDGEKATGIRLFLKKSREEKDSELLYKIRRVKYEGDGGIAKYLVFFDIEKVLPLLGGNVGLLPFEV